MDPTHKPSPSDRISSALGLPATSSPTGVGAQEDFNARLARGLKKLNEKMAGTDLARPSSLQSVMDKAKNLFQTFEKNAAMLGFTRETVAIAQQQPRPRSR